MKTEQKKVKPSILIIDDCEETLALAGRWFEGFCNVFIARSSGEADSILIKNRIDIFLIDVNLGEKESGIRLARNYTFIFPEAAICLWTANIKQVYTELIDGFECIQKPGNKNLIVPPVMHLWSQKKTMPQYLQEKRESISRQLSFGGKVKLESRQEVDGLEAVELSLLKRELLHFMAVAYRNQADSGQTDINLSLGHGCMAHHVHGGPCKMCLIGKISRNVTGFTAQEIVSQIPHLLTGYKSHGYLKSGGNLTIGYSCGNDPIYCWRELMKAIQIIDNVKELQVKHIITTIGSLKMFNQMLPMLSDHNAYIYLSAHATRRLAREWLMRATMGESLWKMADRLSKYSADTGRKWTYCHLLIKDFNDSEKEAWRISELLKGMPCNVKIMTVADNCLPTFPKIVTREDGLIFTNTLKELGVDARFRKNIGGDKAVKCGMHLATHNHNAWKYSEEECLFLPA